METHPDNITEGKTLNYLKEKGSRMTAKDLQVLLTEHFLEGWQRYELLAIALVSLEHAEKHAGENYTPKFSREEVFDRLAF